MDSQRQQLHLFEFDLSQAQRRRLADVLKHTRRPACFGLARWAVLQMGAASAISALEVQVLTDCGLDIVEPLRNADPEV